MLKRGLTIFTVCLLLCCAGCGQTPDNGDFSSGIVSGDLASGGGATGAASQEDVSSQAGQSGTLSETPSETSSETPSQPDTGNTNGEQSSKQEEQSSSSQAPAPTQGPLKLTFYGSGQGGYEKVGAVGSAPSFARIYYRVSELYEDSTDILHGTVKSTENFDETGVGNTLYQFEITKTYKGDLQPGQTISVMTSGGYVRVSKMIEVFDNEFRFSDLTEAQKQNGVYEDFFMGVPIPEAGEEYVLFLASTKDDDPQPPFPSGIYVEKGTFQARFVKREDGTFSRHVPPYEPEFFKDLDTQETPKQSFTLPELEQEIAACQE